MGHEPEKIPTFCKNRYSQIRPIGNGAQGTVYLVLDNLTNEEVVIKRIQLTGDPAEASKAQREVEILTALKEHPHVVRFLHSFDEYEGTTQTRVLNIVMEHCSKGDLGQFIKERAEAPGGPQYLGPELLLRWADQLLQGVEHMHHAGYMHRDLKAANIFITEDMNIKLADFGISRYLSRSDTALTMVGTPWYMAPEVMNLNEKTGYDAKSDVWGLGCILYQMCALRLPFPGDNIMAVAGLVMQNRPDDLPGSVPGHLREMVRRMLCSDPARRPSLQQLRHEMQSYASPQRGARFHAAASPAAEPHGARQKAEGRQSPRVRTAGVGEDARSERTSVSRAAKIAGGHQRQTPAGTPAADRKPGARLGGGQRAAPTSRSCATAGAPAPAGGAAQRGGEPSTRARSGGHPQPTGPGEKPRQRDGATAGQRAAPSAVRSRSVEALHEKQEKVKGERPAKQQQQQQQQLHVAGHGIGPGRAAARGLTTAAAARPGPAVAAADQPPTRAQLRRGAPGRQTHPIEGGRKAHDKGAGSSPSPSAALRLPVRRVQQQMQQQQAAAGRPAAAPDRAADGHPQGAPPPPPPSGPPLTASGASGSSASQLGSERFEFMAKAWNDHLPDMQRAGHISTPRPGMAEPCPASAAAAAAADGTVPPPSLPEPEGEAGRPLHPATSAGGRYETPVFQLVQYVKLNHSPGVTEEMARAALQEADGVFPVAIDVLKRLARDEHLRQRSPPRPRQQPQRAPPSRTPPQPQRKVAAVRAVGVERRNSGSPPPHRRSETRCEVVTPHRSSDSHVRTTTQPLPPPRLRGAAPAAPRGGGPDGARRSRTEADIHPSPQAPPDSEPPAGAAGHSPRVAAAGGGQGGPSQRIREVRPQGSDGIRGSGGDPRPTPHRLRGDDGERESTVRRRAAPAQASTPPHVQPRHGAAAGAPGRQVGARTNGAAPSAAAQQRRVPASRHQPPGKVPAAGKALQGAAADGARAGAGAGAKTRSQSIQEVRQDWLRRQATIESDRHREGCVLLPGGRETAHQGAVSPRSPHAPPHGPQGDAERDASRPAAAAAPVRRRGETWDSSAPAADSLSSGGGTEGPPFDATRAPGAPQRLSRRRRDGDSTPPQGTSADHSRPRHRDPGMAPGPAAARLAFSQELTATPPPAPGDEEASLCGTSCDARSLGHHSMEGSSMGSYSAEQYRKAMALQAENERLRLEAAQQQERERQLRADLERMARENGELKRTRHGSEIAAAVTAAAGVD